MRPFCDRVVAQLDQLLALCRHHQVSFALHYNEHDDSWYVSVDSPAPAERFIGKDTQLAWALDAAIDHLNKLGKPR